MRIRFIAVPLALLLSLPVLASPGLTKKDNSTLQDAAVVLDVLTQAPDKGIPQEFLAKADCILIFPSVAKGAPSRGLFVGVALDGSVVKPDHDANARLYGEATSGREILVDSKLTIPASAQPLMSSIRSHMAAAVAQEKAEKK